MVNYLEERGLLGSETGVLGRDDDIDGGNGSGTSRGLDLVLQEGVPDLVKVLRNSDVS